MFFNPVVSLTRRSVAANTAAAVRSMANLSRYQQPQLRSLSMRSLKSPLSTVSATARARAARLPAPGSSLKLLLGATTSIMLISGFSRPLLNDTINARLPATDLSLSLQTPTYHKSRFGGKLNYEELTIGSVTGLFVGIIAGKLSSVFIFLSLATYFLVEFLESRNIINIPWNYIVTVGKEKINIKELVLEKPSFKISFVLSFLIAAYNI